MKLTAFQAKALHILPAEWQPGMDAGTFGDLMWPNRRGRKIVASHGGGDYAAQMILGRLRKLGLVRTSNSAGSSLWTCTKAGEEALVRHAIDNRVILNSETD